MRGTMTDDPLEDLGPRSLRRVARSKPNRAPVERRPTEQLIQWLWDRYLAEHRLSAPRSGRRVPGRPKSAP